MGFYREQRGAAPGRPRLSVPGSVFAFFLVWPGGDAAAQSTAPLERGAYLFAAAGCKGCHTDTKNQGAALAGGRALKTPFGVFYAPNITPDTETGIGGWSAADFATALQRGIGPDGNPYYPAFPYGAYTHMRAGDVADLWAYLKTVRPVKARNRGHALRWPFNWRFLLGPWRWLNFAPGPLPDSQNPDPVWQRGRYLVEALGHCAECHTPRDTLGGFIAGRHLAGTPAGPAGAIVPNLTPHATTGVGEWSDNDLDTLLAMGMLPDGDFVGDGMDEVVENTGKLTPADRKAIIHYLRALPAIENDVRRKPGKQPPDKG